MGSQRILVLDDQLYIYVSIIIYVPYVRGPRPRFVHELGIMA
jgi:hypothetical protein